MLNFNRFSKIIKPYFRFNSSLTETKQTIPGNVQINYVKSGLETSKNNVLLMPGALGSSWTDFKPQIEGLPKLLPNHSIIAWDPPGYGKSIPPKRQFPVDFFEKDADAAYEFLQALKVPHGFDLCGWSDGGITAMVLAAKYPDAVRKLVIWGSNSYILPKEVKIYESIRDVSKWSQKMREPMEKLYGKEGFPKLWGEWIDGMVSIYKARDGDICKGLLKHIKAKTLIVHGVKDPMILPEHVPFLLKNIMGSTLHEFKDGKHNVHLRYADEFNQVVSKFLA